jgi:hypothetical protein
MTRSSFWFNDSNNRLETNAHCFNDNISIVLQTSRYLYILGITRLKCTNWPLQPPYVDFCQYVKTTYFLPTLVLNIDKY